MSDNIPKAADVLKARKRLEGAAVNTPLVKSGWLSERTGAEIFLKLENLQITGSFKLRGALNALAVAKDAGRMKVFAASAGNHGLGLAEASRITNSDVTVCIPKGASRQKRESLEKYNVAVIEHGPDCEVTEGYARRMAAEKKALYVSPYNNPDVIAGQGTIGMEMLEAIPDLTTLVMSVGGGGLISGVSLAAKALNQDIRIVGVVAANSPVMKECVEKGRIMPVFSDETIADGIAGNIEADTITFPVVREMVDEWVAVEESSIQDGIWEFLLNQQMIIEGAAAATTAAIANGQISFSPGEKAGVVVCGRNIHQSVWKDIVLSRLGQAV